jgi:hypothetical protein
MIEKPAFEFTIVTAGRKQKLVVDSLTAKVGSGAHCEVRLPADEAAVEQLQLWLRADGVYGEARALDPASSLGGAAFVRGRLWPESVLHIGRVELRVARIEPHRTAAARTGLARGSSRLIYALGGVGIPLGILCAGPALRDTPTDWNIAPQTLWAADAPVRCAPETGSELALAESLRASAESYRERAPFSPRDGVQAVELFSRAAACYDLAALAPRAEQAHADAARLKLELERQFHVHQVRLERALTTRQYDQAKRETRILRSFADRRGGAFFDWLATLDRQIDVEFAGSES